MTALQPPALRPRRSVLYLPASNARAIAKARTLPCDAVILDLEDAVAPEAKADARAQALAALREGGFGRREVVVRCNALDTPWGEDDLAALAATPPDAVLAPKIADAGDLVRYDQRLAGAPAAVRLWAMVETCAIAFHVQGVAALAGSTRLAALVMGGNDLLAEMRARPTPDRAPLQPVMALTVAACRAHGLTPIDGVFNALADAEGFETEARQGRDFGFDGKTLIHPSQIEGANRLFGASAEEVAWARAVQAAFAAPENAGRGALKVEGRMVERLHLAEAERILALDVPG